MAQVITATMAITLGWTIYDAPEGKGLACRGHTYDTDKAWVAMPTEFLLGGYVDCGDLVYGCTAAGHCLEGVPVWDSGCLLHHPVWDSRDTFWDSWDTFWDTFQDSGGYGFGIDIPLHMAKEMGFTTMSGTIKVWRQQEGRWWTPPPTVAWDTKHCSGPLTLRGWPFRHRPN